jgi:hypothetical protein
MNQKKQSLEEHFNFYAHRSVRLRHAEPRRDYDGTGWSDGVLKQMAEGLVQLRSG